MGRERKGQPRSQETYGGLWIGDKVGVTTRNAGYIGKITEILVHDELKSRSLVQVQLLQNGAHISKWDTDLVFLGGKE